MKRNSPGYFGNDEFLALRGIYCIKIKLFLFFVRLGLTNSSASLLVSWLVFGKFSQVRLTRDSVLSLILVRLHRQKQQQMPRRWPSLTQVATLLALLSPVSDPLSLYFYSPAFRIPRVSRVVVAKKKENTTRSLAKKKCPPNDLKAKGRGVRPLTTHNRPAVHICIHMCVFRFWGGVLRIA